MAYKARPTPRRLLFARQLERARETAGISVEEAAKTLGVRPPTMSRIESGQRYVKAEEVDVFAELYGVDEDTRSRWREWATWTQQPGLAWEKNGQVGPTLSDFADAESLADELRTWQPTVIPGLLQTAEYSKAIIRDGARYYHGRFAEQPTDAMIALRERRKQILARKNPPKLHAVIGEAALRLEVGGPEVMRGQLQHLLDLPQDRVVVQVLPFTAGPHPSTGGSFIILTIKGEHMVYRDALGEDGFSHNEEHLRTYGAWYEALQVQALPPKESRAFIRGMMGGDRSDNGKELRS